MPLGVAVLAAPLAHRAAEAPLEENLEVARVGVAAFLRYGLYRAVCRREELLHCVQPVAGNRLVYRLAAELLEAKVGEPPRHSEKRGDVLYLDAFRGVLAYVRRCAGEKVRGGSGGYGGLALDYLDRLYEERR